MKVKVKCCKCNKKHYIKAYSFRDAKSKKRTYRQGGFICGKCLGYKLNPYTGILFGRFLV